MRILSWNILQGGGRRIDDILATLQSHQADIVALQEFRHSSSKTKLIAGLDELGLSHNYIPNTTDASTHTVALFSYYPIECKPLTPQPETNHDAVLALQANISIIDSEEPDIDLYNPSPASQTKTNTLLQSPARPHARTQRSPRPHDRRLQLRHPL